VVEKIVEGKIQSSTKKFACSITLRKRTRITIHQLIASKIGKLGENIFVPAFGPLKGKATSRWETVAITKVQQDQKAE